jgi:protein-tyrosine-phosphatase/predicted ATP-grasp superfamily ATP-dependent carboligase
MMHPTLILGNEPRVVVPVARSLHRQGIPVLAAAFGPDAHPVGSRAVKRFLSIDNCADSHARVRAVSHLIRRESVDWVIPSNDSGMAFLAAHYDEFRAAARLACPPPAVTARVLDKQQTMRAAVECGIDIPRNLQFASIADLRAARASFRFPLIAKPLSKEVDAAFKIRYYLDFDALERDFHNDAAYSSKYLLQEYAEGEGFGIELLMEGGEPRLLFAHRRILEHPSTGGVSVVAEAAPLIPELVDSSVRLLNHIGWEGVAMVEFRYDRTARRATLMEINGRYWGSLGLSVAAGVDFPFAAWQIAHGLPITVARDYRPGIQARWTSGVLLRTYDLFVPKDDGMARPSPWRELLTGARAFRPGIRDMLWSWTDPRPGFDETRRVLAGILRGMIKTAARRAIPSRLPQKLRVYRSLDPEIARVYARCQLRRVFLPARAALPRDVHSVLFVCHGNIIRSPMAEALLRASCAVSVRSAGLDAINGRQADRRAVRIAPEFGVTLEQHMATRLTEDLVRQADIIFVMDGLNEAQLLHRFPEAAHKVQMLGAYAPSRLCGYEIPDPFTGSEQDVRECYRTLAACVADVAAQLGRRSVPVQSPTP